MRRLSHFEAPEIAKSVLRKAMCRATRSKSVFGCIFRRFSLVRVSAEPVKSLILLKVFIDLCVLALLRASRQT